MSGRSRSTPTRRLAAAPLVPALPPRRAPLWLARAMAAAGLAALASAAALRWLPAEADPRLAEAQQRQQQLQQEAAQLRMTLGVARAHSAELERQLDALQQRVRECQEELAFFRKAGGPR